MLKHSEAEKVGIEDGIRGHQESGEFGEHVAYIGFWRLACSLAEQGLLISYLIKIKGNCFFSFCFLLLQFGI